MADDPYEILGIARDADKDAIRKAYRRLAKENHPDLHPGDTAAEERFKRIGAANTLLSDPEQRARYDRGEIDASGQERAPPRGAYRDYAQGAQGQRYRASGAGAAAWDEEDLGDIFGDIFGNARRAQPRGPRRGEDHSYSLNVSFVDAITGVTSRITLPTGSTLDVKVPPGIEDGQVLRLRGKGGAGSEGALAGDALIRIQVAPDARFVRDGDDIRTELPVTLKQAVLGASVQVPTPAGMVSMTVPPESDTGRVLRLRGRGVPARSGREAGNLFVTLRVTIGPVDESLKAFLRDWTPATATGGAA
jgi:DnaJ-class molecular chaperone